MNTDSHSHQLNDEQIVTPPLDTVFTVLASSRRRSTLSYLREHSPPMAIADLILEVAAHHHETAINELPDEVMDRETMRFRHRHLPKLVDANLVSVNADRNLVVATETSESVDRLLAISSDWEQ